MNHFAHRGERVAAVALNPGMFVLRYIASSAKTPPRVFARVSPASESVVTLFFAPGCEAGVLSAPGSYALAVAERGGRLQLTILGAPGEDDAVEVKIDPIDKLIEGSGSPSDGVADAPKTAGRPFDPSRDPKALRKVRPPAVLGRPGPAVAPEQHVIAPRVVVERRGRAPRLYEDRAEARGDWSQKPANDFVEKSIAPKLNRQGFGFLGHVARKGDVGAAGGEWIGGPGAPSVIEGVALYWEPARGAELEYQVLVSGAQGKWSAWVRSGVFAGTRGRGLPIVGLRVRLAGDAAKSYRLCGEAHFLGLPAVTERGESLDFFTYASADPLVGLTLDLMRSDETEPGGSDDAPAVSPVQENKAGGSARLRVFKSIRSAKGDVESK